MKILHCADIHLGSKMESRLPKDKADERKSEIRASFNRMVKYAVENNIKVIILAGDVFDSDRPLKKDKEFFYSTVKHNPDIQFLYLRGNHDISESYTEGLDNLKTFSDEWTYYEYGGVTVAGIELNAGNAVSAYSSLNLDSGKINIAVLHGQISESAGKDRVYLKKLRNKNIDYLALGHIHSFAEGRIDERGVYVNPGCPEGRGFDEAGQKGFVEIDVEDGITYKFIPNSYRIFDETEVDISDTSDLYSALRKVRSYIKCSQKDIIRIVLTGETSYDCAGLDSEIKKQLSCDYFFVSVKNKTVRKTNLEELEGAVSLEGEFLRTVLGGDYSDEEKRDIISLGIRVLKGGEAEL